MSRAAASPDVRWCRISPTGWGLLSRGGAHNTPVRAAPDRPASLLELACLRVGKSPCVSILSLTSGHYSLRHGARLCIPDVGRVLGAGAVTGELPGTGYIQDSLARPSLQVGVQFDQPLVRLEICSYPVWVSCQHDECRPTAGLLAQTGCVRSPTRSGSLGSAGSIARSRHRARANERRRLAENARSKKAAHYPRPRARV